MEPTFRDGDFVLASDLIYKFSRPKKGQIVVVFHPVNGIQIIKRIIDVKNDSYFLEGDNASWSSNSNDFGWFERNKIRGRVVYKLS